MTTDKKTMEEKQASTTPTPSPVPTTTTPNPTNITTTTTTTAMKPIIKDIRKVDDSSLKNLSEAQRLKILKKRADKEMKAAKKKAAKLAQQQQQQQATKVATTAAINEANGADAPTIPTTITQSGGARRKPKVPKGTRDYLPEQMSIRQDAFRTIRRIFQSHGAVEIDTPIFELKTTLTGKYGEDSKLIYDLADQGGEQLALRYDLTVPFARYLASNAIGNVKRFHIGKVYRRDQPVLSKGRYREFYQCDFDIAGHYGRMVPDSECLVVVAEILDNLPIGDFNIKINHRILLDAILDICGVPDDKFRMICSSIDKLDKESWDVVKNEMVNVKGLKEDVADLIGEFVTIAGSPWDIYHRLVGVTTKDDDDDNDNGDTTTTRAPFGNHTKAKKALEDLRILFQYLESMNRLQHFTFDLSLARGLDYYTGVIYEAISISSEFGSSVGSIGGGGRYDDLVSMFQESGKITPCVGVSVGIERVFTLMEERLRRERGGSIKRPNVSVLVAQAGSGLLIQRMKVCRLLWDASISSEFNHQDEPKLKYEITNALNREVPFMVVIGEDEWKDNKVKVKDLGRRTEDVVDLNMLVTFLKSKGVVPVGCEFAMEEVLAANTTATENNKIE